jgi:SAM-dependent methyltransferase
VYPNLGHLGSSGWRFDERIGPEEYAELAVGWRNEGAQIIGGCCGVTADHIAAARAALLEEKQPTGSEAGRRLPPSGLVPALRREHDELAAQPAGPWTDGFGRVLYPLPLLPSLTCDAGVFAPTQGSWLVWRYLVRSGVGQGKRCLDVGCGCGVLAIQLALNGAKQVHGIDIDGRAVVNTLANAYRTGVADRLCGTEVDLYMWEPEETYDLIVASLYQMPVDPFEEYTGHRPLDFWGRNLLDQLFSLLPQVLAADGVAYVMQLSIISQQETAKALERLGLQGRIVDFAMLPFTPVFQRNMTQIQRVEDLSDAYHITIGGEDLLVGYVLEVTRPERGNSAPPPPARRPWI